jgi:hypothetical protein
MKKIFILMGFILSLSSLSFAETIYLKNGRSVEGKILTQDTVGVTVMVSGRPKKYFRTQIERIEKEEAVDDGMFYGDISVEKSDLISRLIDSNGISKILRKSLNILIMQAPEGDEERYKEIFSIEEAKAKLAPIYAEYYSEEELEVLVNFYETNAAQKMQSLTQEIMQKVMSVTTDHIKEAAEKR